MYLNGEESLDGVEEVCELLPALHWVEAGHHPDALHHPTQLRLKGKGWRKKFKKLNLSISAKRVKGGGG